MKFIRPSNETGHFNGHRKFSLSSANNPKEARNYDDDADGGGDDAPLNLISLVIFRRCD